MKRSFKVGKAIYGNSDRISAIFLCAVACTALVSSRNLPYGSIRAPDAGFFPRTLSALLLVFGGGIYVSSFIDQVEAIDLDSKAWRVVVASIALCAYALTLGQLGFVIDTIMILLLMMRGFGNMTWTMASLIAVPSVVVSYIGFVQLGVPLPTGPLPF